MKTDWRQQLFGDRDTPALAIVAAHPDDEAIGAGGQLRRWPKAQIIYATDGAPRHSDDVWQSGFVTVEEYASARERESMAAMALAGIGLNQLHHLGFTDQETVLHLEELTGVLVEKFLELQPRFVLTHAYEGGHPDHDSTAFAVHAARNILVQEHGFAPAVIEFTSYFNRAGIMATGEFLPRARSEMETRRLTAEEIHFKERLFTTYRTQLNVLQYFPIGQERFRLAPEYDFSRPPHAGKMYYELFQWGTTGERWRKLAMAARSRMHAAETASARAGELRVALQP